MEEIKNTHSRQRAPGPAPTRQGPAAAWLRHRWRASQRRVCRVVLSVVGAERSWTSLRSRGIMHPSLVAKKVTQARRPVSTCVWCGERGHCAGCPHVSMPRVRPAAWCQPGPARTRALPELHKRSTGRARKRFYFTTCSRRTRTSKIRLSVSILVKIRLSVLVGHSSDQCEKSVLVVVEPWQFLLRATRSLDLPGSTRKHAACPLQL